MCILLRILWRWTSSILSTQHEFGILREKCEMLKRIVLRDNSHLWVLNSATNHSYNTKQLYNNNNGSKILMRNAYNNDWVEMHTD